MQFQFSVNRSTERFLNIICNNTLWQSWPYPADNIPIPGVMKYKLGNGLYGVYKYAISFYSFKKFKWYNMYLIFGNFRDDLILAFRNIFYIAKYLMGRHFIQYCLLWENFKLQNMTDANKNSYIFVFFAL